MGILVWIRQVLYEGGSMIDLFEERLAAQVQIGKRYIPKECIVAFAQGKVGQKIRHVVRDISRAFDVSDR